MAWGYDGISDEAADEAYGDAKDGFEPGFAMDDGADPETEKLKIEGK